MASIIFCLTACAETPSAQVPSVTPSAETPEVPESAPDYELIEAIPREANRFTQGLEFYDGRLLESSGLYQRSFVVLDALGDSAERKKLALPPNIFAEGLTVHDNKLYLLSWKNQLGFIIDPTSGQQLGTFRYRGQGWGLCSNGEQLIMSNGSHQLQFFALDSSFGIKLTHSVPVFDNAEPVTMLNELECVGDKIIANLWKTNDVVIINPSNGQVLKRIDLSELYPVDSRAAGADVLNGIAWDQATQTFLITGKFWPNYYRVKLNYSHK